MVVAVRCSRVPFRRPSSRRPSSPRSCSGPTKPRWSGSKRSATTRARSHLPARRPLRKARPAPALSAPAERPRALVNLSRLPVPCRTRAARSGGSPLTASTSARTGSATTPSSRIAAAMLRRAGRLDFAYLARAGRVPRSPLTIPTAAERGGLRRGRRRGGRRRGRRSGDRDQRAGSLDRLSLLDRGQPGLAACAFPRCRGRRHRMADDEESGPTERVGIPRPRRHVGELRVPRSGRTSRATPT